MSYDNGSDLYRSFEAFLSHAKLIKLSQQDCLNLLLTALDTLDSAPVKPLNSVNLIVKALCPKHVKDPEIFDTGTNQFNQPELSLTEPVEARIPLISHKMIQKLIFKISAHFEAFKDLMIEVPCSVEKMRERMETDQKAFEKLLKKLRNKEGIEGKESDCEISYIKQLETQNSLLKIKLDKLANSTWVESGKIPSPEVTQEFSLEKNSEYECVKAFNDILKTFLNKVNLKISEKFESLTRLSLLLSKIKQDLGLSYLISVQAAKDFKTHYLTTEHSDMAKNFYSLIIHLLTQLKQKPEPIFPTVKISLNCLEPKDAELKQVQRQCEELLLLNMQLKSEILNFESSTKNFNHYEEEIKTLQERCEFLERVNKELASKKDEESDSLDLGCENIKDTIEIQELRAALRSVSERFEQEKEVLLRDVGESQQDMETQLFRLKNEKAYIEVKLKDCEKELISAHREKERLESAVAILKKELERLKDFKAFPDYLAPSWSKCGSSDMQVSASGDFELTESIDKFAAVNSNDLYEILQEEINELSSNVIKNNLTRADLSSNKEIIRNLIENSIKVKKIIDSELPKLDLEMHESLTEILNRLKIKISILESDKAEKDKKIEELLISDRIDGSPRISLQSCNGDSLAVARKQLQMEKVKVFEKRKKIRLHKEQIALLKQNIRELQTENERGGRFSLESVKNGWLSLNKELPILGKAAEEMIEAYMRTIGFSAKDVELTKNLRKGNGKAKIGLSSR